jgi:hypothetical protein
LAWLLFSIHDPALTVGQYEGVVQTLRIDLLNSTEYRLNDSRDGAAGGDGFLGFPQGLFEDQQVIPIIGARWKERELSAESDFDALIEARTIPVATPPASSSSLSVQHVWGRPSQRPRMRPAGLSKSETGRGTPDSARGVGIRRTCLRTAREA